MHNRRTIPYWAQQESYTEDGRYRSDHMGPQRWYQGGARYGDATWRVPYARPRGQCYGRGTWAADCRPSVSGGTGGVDLRKEKKPEPAGSDSVQGGDTEVHPVTLCPSEKHDTPDLPLEYEDEDNDDEEETDSSDTERTYSEDDEDQGYVGGGSVTSATAKIPGTEFT